MLYQHLSPIIKWMLRHWIFVFETQLNNGCWILQSQDKAFVNPELREASSVFLQKCGHRVHSYSQVHTVSSKGHENSCKCGQRACSIESCCNQWFDAISGHDQRCFQWGI